ncbi:MAG: hypothetical protein IT210_15710 [Armatimonadetes bacterium]|nr:hypothetical protein [Armatimonadota bacterium]
MLSRVGALIALPATDGQCIASLNSEYCLELVAAHYALIDRGGSAIQAMKDKVQIREWPDAKSESNKRIKRTIQAIVRETRRLLARRLPHLLCPHCLTRYRLNTLRLPDQFPICYNIGCRTCGDSLAVSCLAHHTLFDFDRVEIRNASDAEIERFGVRVGNDADPIRQKGIGGWNAGWGVQCRRTRARCWQASSAR